MFLSYAEAMPGRATLVSVEEYLSSSSEVDRDYVDGELLERNVGEKNHAKAQKHLLLRLAAWEERLGIFALAEQRVRISATRFRVPDICVMLTEPDEQVFTTAPFLCVEILSPEDRMSRMEERIEDYLRLGTAYVWLVDPWIRRAWSYTQGGRSEVKEALRTENPALCIPLAEIFS